MLLRFYSNAPGGRQLTILNGTALTGYNVLSFDLGNAAWAHEFGGQRGTQGARPSSATPDNRQTSWVIRAAGTTKDDLAAKMKAVEQIADEMRRFGGQIVWQSNNASYRVWFDVMTAGAAVVEWGNRAEVTLRGVVAVSATAAPYVEGDPMDVWDTFFTSSIGDYTFDTGLANTVLDNTIGRIYATSGTGERRFYHSLSGYRPSDVEVTIGYAAGGTTAFVAGAILRRLDANNYLVAQVDTAAAVLRIKKVVAGVETSLANVAITALSVGGGTPYWLKFRSEGNNLYAEHWLSSPNAGGLAAPANTVSYSLTSGAEITQFGKGVKGQVGARLVPSTSGTLAFNFLFSFRSWPYTYRGLKVPRELALPMIDGDADAIADVSLNFRNANVFYASGLIGWTRAPVEPFNMAWNGGAEGASGSAYPWAITAIAGMSLAATSVARQSSNVYAGNFSGRMVTPATSGAGISHPVFRQFRKGTTYTFEVYLRSNTGASASVVLVLGTPGDGNTTTSAPVTLPASGAWTRVTVPWAPTADREVAYAVIKSNAATAYTVDFDAAQLYEGTVAPTAQTHTLGRGGTLPFGAIYSGARETATTPNAFDLVADAQGFSGWTAQVSPTASLPYSVGWQARIDPYLLWPDDYERGVDLELWARAYFGVDLITNGTARVQAAISSYVEASTVFNTGQAYFPKEPGCNPKIVPVGLGVAEWRWLRLGVIPVPTRQPGQLERMLFQVSLSFTGTAGAGADRLLKLDHLDIVPARTRFTGGNWGGNQLPIRVIRSDLSGQQGVAQSIFAPYWDLAPSTGMSGTPIELPSGSDLLAYVRPFQGTVDTSDGESGDVNAKYTPVDVHFAVTPRWAVLRDA